MANYPNSIKQREELNLRLGIKSSLSQLRPVIASLYVLYCANDRKVRFQYSQEINSNGFVSILLDDVLKTKIVNLYENEEVSQLIEKSQLFTSQLEALQVGLELFFHICKIDFVKGGLSERTGSNRYNKSISFSTNMLLLDLFLSSYPTEDVKKLLFNWLQDKEDDSGIENKLKIILNTFTEETQYKIRDEKSNEIIFNQEGVYSEILSSNTVASNDSKEQVGPYRVLKAYISSGLHPFLTDDKQLFYLRANVDHDIFSRYADMVDTTLTLIPKRSVVTQEIEVLQTEKPQNDPNNSIIPLQQIFYGAPGTGKSHKIKEHEQVKKAEEKKLVFRTTFHPDSDYSTFVGAYKPTMKSSERVYTPEELTVKLKEIKTTGTTYPCHKFAARYWESIKDLSPDSIKQILNACGFIDNYSVEVGKGVAIGQEYLNKPEDGKIIYNFCPQTFTNAYVEAWKTEEKVFLVIEEINRGNCAQIFGDLFQLLDRENGISEYSVDADVDLQSYLQKALAESKRDDIPEEVKSGKKLMLPSNLYIWATMNTSDQSLFPIDSAFKRRWDWKYVKIKDEHKDWTVDIDIKTKDSAGNETTAKLDWYVFIDKINEIIASMTSSADKQLGYFFCKPKTKDSKEIDAETFVSKVIFYLWNDVFKDYAFEDAFLFQYTTEVNGNKETKDLTFPDFYNDDESINTTCLTDFIEKVMNWKKGNEDKE